MTQDLKSHNEFISKCISLGFVKTDDPIHPIKYVVSESDDDAEIEESVVSLRVENGHAAFVFASGWRQEFLHLNTLDPVEAISWAKLISDIEPNW